MVLIVSILNKIQPFKTPKVTETYGRPDFVHRSMHLVNTQFWGFCKTRCALSDYKGLELIDPIIHKLVPSPP